MSAPESDLDPPREMNQQTDQKTDPAKTPAPHAPWRAEARALLVTLAAGTAGALLFHIAGLPVAWLSGAMAAIMVLAVAGVDVRLPEILRQASLLILGVSMGSALTPQMLAQASTWPVSMAFLALSLCATMVGSTLFLRRVAGWDTSSAFFASTPGALSTVIAMAADSGADLRKVAFVQAVRLFLLVAGLPLLLGAMQASVPSGPVPVDVETPAQFISGLIDLGVMFVAALICGLLAEKVHLPGGLILGALVASGALHLSGWTDVAVPQTLLVPAFVVLGISVGIRFVGTRIRTIIAFAWIGLGAFAVAGIISAAFALLAAYVTGDDFGKMLAAFAPGALEAMTALSFALGYDPAFMSAHHVFRFASLSVLVPVVARLLFSLKPDD